MAIGMCSSVELPATGYGEDNAQGVGGGVSFKHTHKELKWNIRI